MISLGVEYARPIRNNGRMLENLLGNRTAERVLLYLANYGQGYPREIAATFGSSVSVVLKQLARLESGGILVSRMLGRTRLYELDPRWFFHKELKALLEKALAALPAEEVKRHYRERQRPRRAGKPLWSE
jgi:DNA-binding transcriptional ArsR family regulator